MQTVRRRRLSLESLEHRFLLAFDLTNTLLPSPEGPQHHAHFGHSVAASDEYRLVGVPSAHLGEASNVGYVAVYNTSNQLVAELHSPIKKNPPRGA